MVRVPRPKRNRMFFLGLLFVAIGLLTTPSYWLSGWAVILFGIGVMFFSGW